MTTQVTNSISNAYLGGMSAADAATPEGFNYLTPDALLAYCQTKLQNVDSQMQDYFQKEQTDASAQQVLTQLEASINCCTGGGINTGTAHAALDLLKACQNSINAVGADSPTGQQIATLRDSIANTIDPSGHLAGRLDQPGGGAQFLRDYAANPQMHDADFVNWYGGAKPGVCLDGAAVQAWATNAQSIGSNLGNDSQMGMIQLQSLMSDRQTSIQMCTNLVQSLADQTKGITSNIGH